MDEERIEELREELLCDENDRIDNAVWNAISSMVVGEIEWDMALIGPVEDFIEKILTMKGIPVCHPWEDEDGVLCCCGQDSCPHCWVKGIPGEISE